MKSRSTMKHRTTIQRNTTSSDSGGGFTDSWGSIASDVPCHAWYISSRMATLSDRPSVTETRFVLVPLDTDVRVGDRLLSVTDRRGNVLYNGPLVIDAIGERTDHLPLITRKIV